MANLLFNGDFTSGWQSRNGPISNFPYSCIVAADRFSALSSYAGRDYVGKFILKSGDKCNVTNTDERNQVMGYWSSSDIGTTQWYGFSFMIDKLLTSYGNWLNIWEFGWPTEMINIIDNNTLLIKQRYPNKETKLSNLIITNQWYDILIKLKLSYGSDGTYEVWLRKPNEALYSSSPVHSSTGISAKSTELVHQLGIYRVASPITQTLYIADYKVGISRADVEYIRNGATCPILSCTLSMAT